MRDHRSQLAHLVEENWCAAWASLARVDDTPPTVVADGPPALRIYTPGCAETLLNMVIRFDAPEPVGVAAVERALAPYRRHRLPTQWWLLLGAEPRGLRSALDTVGMRSWGDAPAMALDLAGWQPRLRPLPAGTRLEPVRSARDGAAALAVICEVFLVPEEPMARWTVRNPAFSVYLAWLGEQPVSALATLREGATVGVYHVATRRGARRRGLAGHLLALALGEAQRAGCAWATLTATPEAQRLYEQMGFRAVGSIEQWMPGAPLMSDLLHGRPAAHVAPRADA